MTLRLRSMPRSILWLMLLLVEVVAFGQGTFTYDQQTSTIDLPQPGQGSPIQYGQPGFGQAFTPTLTSVDFIRLNLDDHTPANGIGATLLINLRSGSITGALMAATSPVNLADGFAGTVNFFFPSSVALNPGTRYYFEPVVESGDLWNIIIVPDTYYPGGPLYSHGQAYPFTALWFREGTYVPEPSPTALVLVAAGTLALVHRCRGAFHNSGS